MNSLGSWEKVLHDRSLPPLAQIALARFQFEAIRPFPDGNGRVGRLLITLFLLERGILPSPLLYLSAFFAATRSEYHECPRGVQERGSRRPGCGLFTEAPALHDVVLMNPPFGGKEGKEAQTKFAYKTSATQVLFLQHVIDSLTPGGRCGIVLDEGVLFRTNETAFVQTKRKLLDECDLWCIVSLPPGAFVNAGAGVKTNLLFFTRGLATERVWYYDLSDVKVGKKSPLTLAHFDELFRLLPDRVDSGRSWTVSRQDIEAKGYDLKAVNPHARANEDRRTPEELLDLIEAKGQEVAEAMAALRALLDSDRSFARDSQAGGHQAT